MHGQGTTVIDWDNVWKIEKYPLWMKEGKVGKYWDANVGAHLNSSFFSHIITPLFLEDPDETPKVNKND